MNDELKSQPIPAPEGYVWIVTASTLSFAGKFCLNLVKETRVKPDGSFLFDNPPEVVREFFNDKNEIRETSKKLSVELLNEIDKHAKLTEIKLFLNKNGVADS